MIALLLALAASLASFIAPAGDAGLVTEPAPPAPVLAYAEDGTVTVNRVLADGRVAGTVIPPDATWFEFGETSCAPLVLDEDGTEDLSLLFKAGWTGKPEDGMEALYPQGC